MDSDVILSIILGIAGGIASILAVLVLGIVWLRIVIFLLTLQLEIAKALYMFIWTVLRALISIPGRIFRIARGLDKRFVVSLLALVVVIGAFWVVLQYRNEDDSATGQPVEASDLVTSFKKELATSTPSPTSEPTQTPNVKATRDARPTATAPILSSVYPTSTPDDPGKTSEPREKKCPGYSTWIAGQNERIYRAGVLLDLLDTSLDDDFEGLELSSMKKEIQFLIREERRNDPPDEIQQLQNQTLEWMGLIQDMIEAAIDGDWSAYNSAVDDFNGLQDSGAWLQGDEFISDQCG